MHCTPSHLSAGRQQKPTVYQARYTNQALEQLGASAMAPHKAAQPQLAVECILILAHLHISCLPGTVHSPSHQAWCRMPRCLQGTCTPPPRCRTQLPPPSRMRRGCCTQCPHTCLQELKVVLSSTEAPNHQGCCCNACCRSCPQPGAEEVLVVIGANECMRLLGKLAEAPWVAPLHDLSAGLQKPFVEPPGVVQRVSAPAAG